MLDFCTVSSQIERTYEKNRESIREIRKRTNKPFGIGATLLMPGKALCPAPKIMLACLRFCPQSGG
jgi:hypothetical protein